MIRYWKSLTALIQQYQLPTSFPPSFGHVAPINSFKVFSKVPSPGVDWPFDWKETRANHAIDTGHA